MSACNTVCDLRDICSEHFSELTECGFTKPSCGLVMEEKCDIIQALTLHQVILKSKAEIDQFGEGVAFLGTLEAMKKYPELLQCFFVQSGEECLTAGEE